MTPKRADAPVFAPTDLLCAVCGGSACFGLEFPANAKSEWFCPAHKPADFYTRRAA